MDSSSSSLSSDWDIVNSASVISEEPIEESPNEITSNEWVDDKERPPMCSGVDDINDADINNHNDSNSSSDIDVIEETAEDLIRMSISPMEYSINSSLSVGSLLPSPAPVPNVEEGWNSFLFIQRLLRNPHFKDYLIVIFMSIVIASTVHFQGTPEDKMKDMKEQVDELKKENTNLRNHVISSKIEDDKLFLILDEQIRALKMENHKLSNSLQTLIIHLEEQTAIFKKENEMREKDPYKNEINKLKEQVNLLQIDNDELQKQLVRMRYGAYTPNSEKTKEENVGEDDVKLDNNENKIENLLTEEIEKLKKKLFSEVDELNDWKEAINNLIKRLNDKEKKGPENKEGFENKKTTNEKFRKPTKEDKNEETNKEQTFYDWSWKDLKKNFKDTFDNINVSEMFSKYASVDKKKVKGVFDSVNHYFKKAQEKTKKILNFNGNGKDEVWNFLGDLRKKWADMRDEFFETNPKNGPVPPGGDKKEHKKDHASAFPDKSHNFEDDKKKSNSHFKTKDQQPNKPKMDQNNLKKEQIPTFERLMNDPKLKHKLENGFVIDWEAEIKKFFEERDLNDISNEDEQVGVDNDKLPNEQAKKPEDSWILRRAVMRSIFRENDDQEDSTNWFLRRKKPAKGDFDTEFYDTFEENE